MRIEREMSQNEQSDSTDSDHLEEEQKSSMKTEQIAFNLAICEIDQVRY